MGTDAKVYAASLSDYNAGRLIGEWFNLSDYSDGEELIDAVQEYLASLGPDEYGCDREEWAFHDYEGFPRELYSESMDFDALYSYIEACNQWDKDAIDAAIDLGYDIDKLGDACIYGPFDSDSDFAAHYLNEMGYFAGVREDILHHFDYDSWYRDSGFRESNGYYVDMEY